MGEYGESVSVNLIAWSSVIIKDATVAASRLLVVIPIWLCDCEGNWSIVVQSMGMA